MNISNLSARASELFILNLLGLIMLTAFAQAQSGSGENLERFLQRRLLNDICPIDSNGTAKRVFVEYGAVFAADIRVRFPTKCMFANESEVQQFQKQIEIKNAVIRGVNIELQKPAMESLLEAIAEASAKGLKITPLDGSIAARRSYSDTVKIWNSRFLPALNYWVRKGKISLEESEAAKNAESQRQVEKLIEWELKGWYFSTDYSKSIFLSTAPPGTSQHLSMLAFDTEQHGNVSVRNILNKFGWFQTIISDAPHFTYLGVQESDLSRRGLKAVTRGGYKYWIPNI